MELSKRLLLITEYIDKGSKIGDVGTDHGYIPIYAVKNGICNFAIASDINKGPIEKCKVNVGLEGLKDRVSCRLGGGLKPYKKGEVNGIIIAGMGGNLTRDILEADIDIVESLDYMILLPAQNPEILREYLYTNGYTILNEDLCYDEGKFYELFKVRRGEPNLKVENKLDYEISPLLVKNKNSVMVNYLYEKIDKNEKILSFIKEDTDNARRKKEALVNKIDYLKKSLCKLMEGK